METLSNKTIEFRSLIREHEKKVYLKEMILDDAIFCEFYSILNDIELSYLSMNQTLSTAMINRLFGKNLDHVNINLLKNNKCAHDKIEYFLKLNDKIYNISMAHNSSLKKTDFYKLFEHLDLDVNISLAYNNKTPKEIIKELALLNNEFINEALCSNVNTPMDVLQYFSYDGVMNKKLSHNHMFKTYTKNMVIN